MTYKKHPITNENGEVVGYLHGGFHTVMKSLEPKIGTIGTGLIHHLIAKKHPNSTCAALHVDGNEVSRSSKSRDMTDEEAMSILDFFIIDPIKPKKKDSKKDSKKAESDNKAVEEKNDDHHEVVVDETKQAAYAVVKKKKIKIGLEKPKIQEGPIPEIILK